MANVRNINKLIKLLETLPEPEKITPEYKGDRFDIRGWRREYGECGTIACIGGWAEVIMIREGRRLSGYEWVTKWLGISSEEAYQLYLPPVINDQVNRPSGAIKALRNLAAGCEAEKIWAGVI